MATTIRHFRQLRELEMVISSASSDHEVFLPSITSRQLRKIIILTRGEDDSRDFLRQIEPWASVDKHLCEVVDRLRAMGYQHTLEVELRFAELGDDPSGNDFTYVLPKFREKGVVTVIDGARRPLFFSHNS